MTKADPDWWTPIDPEKYSPKNGWKANPGKTAKPRNPGKTVRLLFRCGRESNEAVKAGQYVWSDRGQSFDIIMAKEEK